MAARGKPRRSSAAAACERGPRSRAGGVAATFSRSSRRCRATDGGIVDVARVAQRGRGPRRRSGRRRRRAGRARGARRGAGRGGAARRGGSRSWRPRSPRAAGRPAGPAPGGGGSASCCPSWRSGGPRPAAGWPRARRRGRPRARAGAHRLLQLVQQPVRALDDRRAGDLVAHGPLPPDVLVHARGRRRWSGRAPRRRPAWSPRAARRPRPRRAPARRAPPARRRVPSSWPTAP